MKRSKFSGAQVAMILRQADEGATIVEVCRKAGISEAMFTPWRCRSRIIIKSPSFFIAAPPPHGRPMPDLTCRRRLGRAPDGGDQKKWGIFNCQFWDILLCHRQPGVASSWIICGPPGRSASDGRAERCSYRYKGKRTDPVALKRWIKEIAETRVRYG